MTDKELIRILRVHHEAFPRLIYGEAADRLEALIAENEHLCEVTKMVPQWHPASEPPEEDGRYLCSVMSLVSNGRNYADILRYDKDGFRDGHIYTDLVTHWMPLPEPPSTEDSPTGQKG